MNVDCVLSRWRQLIHHLNLFKHDMQAAQVFAVDISSTAVAYARRNVAATGLPQHVQVLEGSWLEPVKQHMINSKNPLVLGGIVSNPPYIPHDEMATLQREVGQHEPWSALDGGPGPGLDSLMVSVYVFRSLN